MLFDFHQTENAKKPGSVNATYLISGVPQLPETPATNGAKQDGNDHVMQSSPYMSSMPQPDESQHRIRLSSFLLAREEHLPGEILTHHHALQTMPDIIL
jgi:DNA polymerase delta subunit 3